jgi:glycosyltransferase involved in cell wall biosynthesis
MNCALISVVVPAHNAARTIAETLATASAQSYPWIEIIVVDDGSADDTAAIVRRHAAADPRIRYIHQHNQGVAAARNRGIAAANGLFIATLDADDLWHPDKLTLQMACFDKRGDATALVYCWCCWIGEQDQVLGYAPPLRLEGRLIDRMCRGDLIVSCSNALIRRDALLAAGGFDESLRARGAQGCEDWALYLRIAARHEIGAATNYLVGYRLSPGSMSEDFGQMLRSRALVEQEFVADHPQLQAEFARGRAILAQSLGLRAVRRGQFRQAVALMAGYPEPTAHFAVKSALWLIGAPFRRSLRRMRERSAGHVPHNFYDLCNRNDRPAPIFVGDYSSNLKITAQIEAPTTAANAHALKEIRLPAKSGGAIVDCDQIGAASG